MTKKPLFLLAVAASVTAAAALAGPASTASTRNVKVGDNYFVKDDAKITVTVKKNRRVRWRWSGDSPHNVTVTSGPVKFHSKDMTSGAYPKTRGRKMTRTGTYRIVCTIHGATDQSMTLIVK